jgi:hypothetical protein
VTGRVTLSGQVEAVAVGEDAVWVLLDTISNGEAVSHRFEIQV